MQKYIRLDEGGNNMIKQYIRLDEEDNVIHGFSDIFNDPLESDIEYDSPKDGHFCLFGITNPVLTNDSGVCLYEYMNGHVVPKNSSQIEQETKLVSFEPLRQTKLTEINTSCGQTIANGIDVPTADGTKRFSLSNEDQMNITALFLQLQSALKGEPSTIDLGKGVPYHADAELCKYWGAEDFANIANSATQYVFYHTTYANHLRFYINRITDYDELQAVQYGMDLPSDLKQSMSELIESRR